MNAISKRRHGGNCWAALQHARKKNIPCEGGRLKKNFKGCLLSQRFVRDARITSKAKCVKHSVTMAASAILPLPQFNGKPLYGALLDEGGFSNILPIQHPMVMVYIASCQPGNRLIYVSPQIANLGFSPEAWLAETDLRLQQIHQGDFDRVSQALLHSRSTGEKFNCYYRLYDSNGKIHWLHDEASVVCEPSGAPLFISGVMLDITEKKMLETELHEHRYCLERQVEIRTGQLMKRTALLESCNASLSDKLALTHQEIAKLKLQRAVKQTFSTPQEEISDWARSMIVCRVAATGVIS